VTSRLSEAVRASWQRRREKFGPGGRRDCLGVAEMERQRRVAQGDLVIVDLDAGGAAASKLLRPDIAQARVEALNEIEGHRRYETRSVAERLAELRRRAES
jgi:hypothetical protein